MIVVFHSFTEKSSLLGRRSYGFVSNQAFLPQVRSAGLAQSVVRLTVERVVAGSIPSWSPFLEAPGNYRAR